MDQSQNDSSISDEESFQNGYYYFVKAVEILAMSPEEQCECLGYCNVAWELKDDVSAGAYLFNLPTPSITNYQKGVILTLINDLNSIPSYVLKAGIGVPVSLESMRNQCWEPLRLRASRLLKELETATESNKRYFESKSERP